MNIDEFINFATNLSLWDFSTKSIIEIDSINVSNNSATLHGEWTLGDDMSGYKFPTEVQFIKSNDTWLITTINLGDYSEYYEGEENEPFDPTRHNAYVSFKADGELHVFHDHYGGTDPNMTQICTYNNEFSIKTYKYETEEEFRMDFYWNKSQPGSIGELYGVQWYPNGDNYEGFENLSSDFTVTMDSSDLSSGLVKGTFSGHVLNDSGESVHITEGFFYIEHEFNLPEVTIENPTDGESVSGDVTISGTATDESELIDVDIELHQNFDEGKEVFNEDLEGTTNWNTTINSTKYQNGEYTLEVFARDKHYNYSLVKNITINIAN